MEYHRMGSPPSSDYRGRPRRNTISRESGSIAFNRCSKQIRLLQTLQSDGYRYLRILANDGRTGLSSSEPEGTWDTYAIYLGWFRGPAEMLRRHRAIVLSKMAVRWIEKAPSLRSTRTRSHETADEPAHALQLFCHPRHQE